MRNKNLLLKLGLIVMTIGGFGLSFTSAATIFHLNIEGIKAAATKDITDNMMYVHFADNDNNFGGFLYFSNGSGDAENVAKYDVKTDSSEPYNCRKKIKGFYYNAERGERLWPLDDETWKSVLPGLTTSGGIFANCVGSGYQEALNKCDGLTADSYKECVDRVKKEHRALGFGYYGSVSQSYMGKDFNLTVGVNYDTSTDFITISSGSELVPTFERLDNQVPVGFVYDYNGGVGLAGCRFRDGIETVYPNPMKRLVNEYKTANSLSNIFKVFGGNEVKYDHTRSGSSFSSGDIVCEPISVADTLLRILIEGIVGMNEGGDDGDTKYGSLGNSSDTKMQYFGTKSVNASTLMNYAIKKAELLCRGKWTDNPSVFSSANGDKLICWDSNSNVTSGMALKLRKDGKTLVSKRGNVTVIADTGRDIGGYYDIYLLDGNLLIDESGVVDNAGRFVFNTGGFVSTTSVETFSGAVYSALCPVGHIECDGIYNGSDAVVGSLIRGNFIVNGEIKGAGTDEELKNKYFIYGKMTAREDTFNSLERKFSWTCENGFGKDGNYCPKFDGNPYWNAALVVIDQNYGSPLLR